MPPTVRHALAALALATAVSSAVAAPVIPPAVEALERGYVAAWDRADAPAIAAFFAPDGDFTNPTGFHAQGPADVAAFYSQAFAAGYGGSRGGLKVLRTRVVAPGVMLVDGEWSIRGAHTAQGAARPGEQGSATAVLVRAGHTWRIAALREQAAP